MSEDFIVCPRCGSIDLEPPDNGISRVELAGVFPLPNSYRCRRCGYTGFCPAMSEEELLEFRRELAQAADDNNTGA